MLTNWIKEAKNFDDQYTESTPLKMVPFIGSYVKNDLQLRQDIILETLGDVKGAKILDLGCGVGRLSHILSNKGAYVIGYDVSKEAIDIANKYKKKLNLIDKCEFHITNIENIDTFPAADIWIGIGLWQYLNDPIKILLKLNHIPKFVTDFPRTFHWINPMRKIYRTILKGIKFKSYSESAVHDVFKKSKIRNYNINYSNPTIYISYY